MDMRSPLLLVSLLISRALCIRTYQHFTQTSNADVEFFFDDLNVTDSGPGSRWLRWTDTSHLLYYHLVREAIELLDERDNRIGALGDNRTAWQAYVTERQPQLAAILTGSPLPANDLNVETTGVLQTQDGYRVEKLVYQSLPGFYVTAALFVPDNAPTNRSLPAVAFASGHYDPCFRYPMYQTLLINLVKKGFVVLAWDTLGQGERVQYWDAATNTSTIGEGTAEHDYLGRQTFLNGEPFGKYMLHDGQRAIDYLQSRPEVDPSRIGYCGQSGGGTQTASMMVVDRRIVAASPSSYETTFRQLLEAVGPQDAEQVFPGAISGGFDIPDTLLLRAPLPTLVLSTTDDFFPIQGALDGFAQAQQAFAALGAADNVQMATDDWNHGYTPLTRSALYAFFMQHLSVAGNSSELNVTLLDPALLQISPTGQVATSYNSKRVQDFNFAYNTVPNVAVLQQKRSDLPQFLSGLPSVARSITGYREPAPSPKTMFKGRVNRPGYNIEKWIVLSEGHSRNDETQLIVPLLVFVPVADIKAHALLFVDPLGKTTNADVGGFFEQLVMAGFIVAAADLSGVGEAGPAWSGGVQGYGETYVEFVALYLNRSIVGIHAADIVSVTSVLRRRPDVSSVTLIANETLSEAALHASLFTEAGLAGLALVHPLVSYEQTASIEFYSSPPWNQIFGVLRHYDLCDVAAALAPIPLLAIAPRDGTGAEASTAMLQYSYNSTTAAYLAKNAAAQFTLAPDGTQTPEEILLGWLKSVHQR